MLSTPIYQLPLTDDLDPASDVAAHMRALSTKVEEALLLGGVAAPGAEDLLQLSARVTAIEAQLVPVLARVVSPASPSPAQTIAASTFTAVTMAAPSDDLDPLDMWNPTFPTRLTIPAGRGGLYGVTGTGAFASGTNTTTRYAEIRCNGVLIPGANASSNATTTNHIIPLPTAVVRLVPGDKLELFQWSAAATNVATSGGQTAALQVNRLAL